MRIRFAFDFEEIDSYTLQIPCLLSCHPFRAQRVKLSLNSSVRIYILLGVCEQKLHVSKGKWSLSAFSLSVLSLYPRERERAGADILDIEILDALIK